jgi:dTDP-4-dehydrorhamnose reductase
MRLLVAGASGLVGWNLRRTALDRGHEVLGTYATFPLTGLQPLEIGDEAAAENLLQEFKPDAVACCSAWSWVDGCQRDPARAFRENAEKPARLARLSFKMNARFLYYSSSYVFDGQAGPYPEDAPAHPISIYGESKWKGEEMIREATQDEGLIVRTMGVYGEEPQRKNFVYTVARMLGEGKPMRLPSNQFGNASHAGDMAETVLSLLDRKASGIWNVAGPEPELSRKDFALRIASAYGLDASLLEFVPTESLGQEAPRPRQGGLLIGKAVAATGFTPASWRPISLERSS